MKKIIFRKCKLEENSLLRSLSMETFTTAFAEQNTKEDMDAYVSTAFSEAQIITELRNANSTFYFVETGNQIIGYLKLNVKDAQSESIANGLEIERIYLLASYQGRGIGQLMMDKAIAVARQMRKERIWLGVWGKNYGAVRFYQRNGFKKFAEHDFYLGKDLQTDWLMDLSIQ